MGETYESFPVFTSLISDLYVEIGEEPVGRPRTNGFSGVGAKSLMLLFVYELQVRGRRSNAYRLQM